MQILSGNVNVGEFDASLQMLPEIFHPVDVCIPLRIFARAVFYRFVFVASLFQSVVGKQFVRVNPRTLNDIRLNNRLQGFLGDVRNNLRYHLPVALHHAKDDRFVLV